MELRVGGCTVMSRMQIIRTKRAVDLGSGLWAKASINTLHTFRLDVPRRGPSVDTW